MSSAQTVSAQITVLAGELDLTHAPLHQPKFVWNYGPWGYIPCWLSAPHTTVIETLSRSRLRLPADSRLTVTFFSEGPLTNCKPPVSRMALKVLVLLSAYSVHHPWNRSTRLRARWRHFLTFRSTHLSRYRVQSRVVLLLKTNLVASGYLWRRFLELLW